MALQNSGAFDFACAQLVQCFVGLGKWKELDVGAHWHLRGQCEELLPVPGGEVGYRTDAPFFPEQVVGKRRNVAHMNTATNDHPAFLDDFERLRNEFPGRREKDSRLQRDWERLSRIACPN